jgi:hypothetical protein
MPDLPKLSKGSSRALGLKRTPTRLRPVNTLESLRFGSYETEQDHQHPKGNPTSLETPSLSTRVKEKESSVKLKRKRHSS